MQLFLKPKTILKLVHFLLKILKNIEREKHLIMNYFY